MLFCHILNIAVLKNILHLSAHKMCVRVCVCVCGVDACMYVYPHMVSIRCLPQLLSTVFNTGSCIDCGAISWVGCVANELQGSSCLCVPLHAQQWH